MRAPEFKKESTTYFNPCEVNAPSHFDDKQAAKFFGGSNADGQDWSTKTPPVPKLSSGKKQRVEGRRWDTYGATSRQSQC